MLRDLLSISANKSNFALGASLAVLVFLIVQLIAVDASRQFVVLLQKLLQLPIKKFGNELVFSFS